jgi:CheY-like chemotaxis protein
VDTALRPAKCFGTAGLLRESKLTWAEDFGEVEVRRNTMGCKILVVDDEEPVRDLLRDFLEGEGHTVVMASSGNEALLSAEKESPQLIVLDVRMPGLDGIETCAALRANEKTRRIPIILATAFREVLEEALAAGIDDFVTKPFHLAELLHRVQSLLRVRHLENDLERAAAYVYELRKDRPKR